MNFFKEQYENSERIRKGIDAMLRSPVYTEEYKNRIRRYLEIDNVSIFDKEESLSVREGEGINEIIVSSRKGGSFGYVERPVYIEDELEKALDIEVDELIPAAPKTRIETVSRERYEDLREQYAQAVQDLSELREDYNNALSTIDTLRGEIQTLLQSLDAERLQTAVANNELEAANERYAALLGDFQIALQKGIQEAIERVSLEAQVRGLQAQKETLQQLLETATELAENTQERQAAAEVLDGVPGTFDQKTNSGWKLPQSEITREDDVLFIRTRNDDDVRTLQGTAINIYNFNADEAQTFTIQVLGDARNFLEAPTSITIPAREGTSAGRGYISLRWRPLGSTGGRNQTFEGAVQINGSLGDSHSIEAKYEKEVRRSDKWSPRGTVRAVVGQEKN